jgi:hypothetical protein
MNPTVKAFVEARLPFSGLAAWSVRLPDQTMASHSCFPWLPGARAEHILHRLTQAADELQRQRLEPVRLCWAFEHLRLYLARGRAGACLALVVQNSPDFPPAAAETVLDDFIRLEL